MKKFLMCEPKYYEVDYEINDWMHTENQPDLDLANKQWHALKDKMTSLRCKIDLIEPQPDVPDMVFTANAGMFSSGDEFILSNFKYEERKEEEIHFEKHLSNRYKIYKTKNEFEGAGDALYLNRMLVCAHGFRSKIESYSEEHFPKSLTIVKLIDSRFYHLDTCFCPLKGGQFMYYPGAIEGVERIKLISSKAIEIPEEDAVKFACNAVCVGKDVILPEGANETIKILEKHGYTCHPVDMSEFIKAGGACKCLTLRYPV